eukprot:scpid66060/ scgid17433/ Acyl-CoA dehydrogenase family member 11
MFQRASRVSSRGSSLIFRTMTSSAANSSAMDMFPCSDRGKRIYSEVIGFMNEFVYPAEPVYIKQYAKLAEKDRWQVPQIIEDLKVEAKRRGLWNLFLPSVSKLSQTEYAFMAEQMGRSVVIAPEAFNCSAPDTGNMEVLHLFGTEQQKAEWLEPLLDGRIRSCFCMTEPDVASSDATNMECEIRRDGNEYVINGKKWWSSGAGDPRCKISILMGKSTGLEDQPIHKQHSMILVPLDTPGVEKVRPLTVFGFDDAPHGHLELHFKNVRVPVRNLILGEGRGFEIAQSRLGPGRIHHCMRLIGMAERGLEAMCQRACQRTAFGKAIARQGTVQADIALSRIEIDQARLLTLQAARLIDARGNRAARHLVAMIKVSAPRMACAVLDRAIQVHGGAGVSQDPGLAHLWVSARSLRIADGPDEVHLATVARGELKPYAAAAMAGTQSKL